MPDWSELAGAKALILRRSGLDGEADFKGRAVTFAGLETDLPLKNPAKLLDDSQPEADARYIVARGPFELVAYAVRVGQRNNHTGVGDAQIPAAFAVAAPRHRAFTGFLGLGHVRQWDG